MPRNTAEPALPLAVSDTPPLAVTLPVTGNVWLKVCENTVPDTTPDALIVTLKVPNSAPE